MAEMRTSRTVVGAFAVAAEFDGLAAGASLKATGVVRHYGQLLQTKVKARASGRPGPRAITGDYRRSISLEFGLNTAGTYSAEVGTNLPQGRRLEWGFWDQTDALGRHFFQPPFPHFEPAMDEIEPLFVAALTAVMPE